MGKQIGNVMRKRVQSGLALVLTVVMLVSVLGSAVVVRTEDDSQTKGRYMTALSETQAYLKKTVEIPGPGTMGGDWVVLGLMRNGGNLSKEDIAIYGKRVARYVKEAYQEKGMLHQTKSTEYARTILGLTASGQNVRNVAGINLLEGLGDYSYVKKQGLNGIIWSLLALDSHQYEIVVSEQFQDQNTREKMVAEILNQSLNGGGWMLGSRNREGTADPDLTAMALSALAPYKDRAEVKTVIEEAIAALSKVQTVSGGFASYGLENAESDAQVITALCTLGIDPFTDERFIKNGHSLGQRFLDFHIKNGGFAHIFGQGEELSENQIATEQGFYALVAIKRLYEGENSLFHMMDVSLKTDAISAWKPGKVTGLKVAAQGNGKIRLTFNSIRGAQEYLIFESTKSGEKGKQIATVEGKTTCLISTEQKKGKKCYYRVQALGKVLEYQVSGTISKGVKVIIK